MSALAEFMRDRRTAPSVASSPLVVSPLDRALRVTFFQSPGAPSEREEAVSLRGLLDRLRTTTAPSKGALPWLKLARFGDVRTERGSLRHDANVLEIHGIEADYDGEQLTMERARAVLQGAGLAAVLYTSPSHTPDNPRWRLLCPTSAPLPPDARVALVARVNGLFVGALANESFALSQSYYYGAVEGGSPVEAVVVEGKAIDLASELDAGALGKACMKPEPAPMPAAFATRRPSHAAEGGTAYGRAALERECDSIRAAPDGTKHARVNSGAYAIRGLVAAGELQEGEAFAALSDALNAILPACRDKAAAFRTLTRAFEDGKRDARQPPPGMAAPPAEEVHPAAAFLAKLNAAASKAQAKPLDVPPGIMDLDGALGMFVDHCNATAISPQPLLALAAGIAMVGVLAGGNTAPRRTCGPTSTRWV